LRTVFLQGFDAAVSAGNSLVIRVPVPDGQALKSGPSGLQAASHPDSQLAPGIRVDCSVYFEQVPTNGSMIAIKDGEYQLRVNPAKEGGAFAFFVNLDGWEPRVSSDERVLPGHWYRLTARWDGSALTLDVSEAPALTSWTLRDNRGYATVEELDRARPFNRPSVIEGGADIRTEESPQRSPRLRLYATGSL